MSARIATLRLARREIRRHKWRSLLIVLLIVVPVAAATGVDIAWRTSDSVQLQREQIFGGADAIIKLRYGNRHFATIEAVRAALPAGSRVVERTDSYTELSAAGHRYFSYLLITDRLGDSMLRNKAQLLAGRGPSAPDEAAVTPLVADSLGLLSQGSLRPGSTVTLSGSPPLAAAAVPANAPAAAAATPARAGSVKPPTASPSRPTQSPPIKVVGLIREPFCLDCSLTLVPSGSPLDSPNFAGLTEALGEFPPSYRGPDAMPLTALDALGVPVALRDKPATWPRPTPEPPGEHHRQVESLVAILVLAEGLGLLEIVVLAGTAFAVGARRQERELGLLAGQGAAPRDLRHLVLAQGLLLAGIGSLLGVGLGFAGERALHGIIERETNQIVVGTHFGLIEIASAAGAGLFSGVLAALFPALAASRRPVVQALRSRFTLPAARRRWAPVLGTALLLAAVVAADLAAAQARADGFCDNGGVGDARLQLPTVVCPHRPDNLRAAVVILCCSLVAIVGLLLVMPAVLAGLSKAGGRLSPTVRMATRDATRHRHRTGPATIAIAMAVGGAVGICCLIASADENPRERHSALTPPHILEMSVGLGLDPAQLPVAATAAAAQLPGSRVLPVPGVRGDQPSDEVVVDPSPDGSRQWVALATPALVVLASGRTADRAVVTAALNAGKVIVFDPGSVRSDGTAELGAQNAYWRGPPTHTVRIPALVLTRPKVYVTLPGAFIGEPTLAAHHWKSKVDEILIDYPAGSASHATTAMQAAQADFVEAYTSDGRTGSDRLLRDGLATTSAGAGLAGVLICMTLAAAEGRPDLATLTAIGAPPGRRRRLGAAQALLPALLGTAVGLALGFWFAVVARTTLTTNDRTVIPWHDLLAIVAAVPVAAALIGVLGSLGCPVLTRRAD